MTCPDCEKKDAEIEQWRHQSNMFQNMIGEKWPTSFGKLNWACGHAGPGACHQCFKNYCDENARLNADLTALKESLNQPNAGQLSQIEQLRAQLSEARTELSAWKEVFGSSQLTHAKDNYDVAVRAAEKLQAENSRLTAENGRLREAATKWPRCCDLWQDSMGGMACVECQQKTFAMMRMVQEVIGVRKDCAVLAPTEEA